MAVKGVILYNQEKTYLGLENKRGHWGGGGGQWRGGIGGGGQRRSIGGWRSTEGRYKGRGGSTGGQYLGGQL